MKIFINGVEQSNEDVLIVFDVEDTVTETNAELHIHPTDEGLVFDLVHEDEVTASTYDFAQELADRCVRP